MFLVEYAKGDFINVDKIVSVHIHEKVTFFTFCSDELPFVVEENKEKSFIEALHGASRVHVEIKHAYYAARKGKSSETT